MKYKNKNFKISLCDSVLLLFLVISFVLGGFFLNSYLSTKSKYNIEQTAVDFIIPSPSDEQVESIKNLDHIASVVPYGFAAKSVSKQGQSIKTNIFIIDDVKDIDSTVFSNKLLVSSSEETHTNAMLVSSKVADSLKLNIGDEVSATVFDNEIKYTIAAIYEDDQRNVGGTVMVVMSGDLAQEKPQNYIYSGAYISSNNYQKTKEYLDGYKPLGDLRPREDFESDEIYEIYLESRENTDYTKMIFYRDAFLADVSSRNDSKLTRELTVTIIVDIIGLLAVFAWIFIRALKYCKNEVRGDIRNNYSVKQEQKMFNTYFALIGIISLAVAVVLSLVTNLIWGIKLLSMFNIISFVAIVALVIIAWGVQTFLLKKMFAKKQ